MFETTEARGVLLDVPAPLGLPADPLANVWWVGDEWAAEVDPAVDEPELDGSTSAPWDSPDGLDSIAPGPGLASVLEGIDTEAVGDAMLVEVVAAFEKLASWAHLNAALTAAELSHRESMNPTWGLPRPAVPNVAGDELAFRLGWSKRAAARLVRDGLLLATELIPTADAVRAGAVDTTKLRVLTDRLAGRPWQLSIPVQEAVLPAAATRTPTQLAADIDRELLKVDSQDAADRVAAAGATRRVCHPRRLPDGMAGIWVVLPADEAALVDATVDACARSARAAGDPRTLDQLRADTLVALATGAALPEADATDTPRARVPRVRVDVRVDLTTLLGLDEQPADLTGFGPIPAGQARALAMRAGTPWRRIVTDPLTGAVLDVGRTRYRPPAAIAEHVRARDRVCAGVCCSTPARSCDLDHTTEYYGTPANGSPVPGTTGAGNLGPLSSRCHRLKTDGGFTLRQPEPGVFEWLTPAGLAYRVTPGDDGRVERLRPGDRTTTTDPNPGYPDEPPF